MRRTVISLGYFLGRSGSRGTLKPSVDLSPFAGFQNLPTFRGHPSQTAGSLIRRGSPRNRSAMAFTVRIRKVHESQSRDFLGEGAAIQFRQQIVCRPPRRRNGVTTRMHTRECPGSSGGKFVGGQSQKLH